MDDLKNTIKSITSITVMTVVQRTLFLVKLTAFLVNLIKVFSPLRKISGRKPAPSLLYSYSTYYKTFSFSFNGAALVILHSFPHVECNSKYFYRFSIKNACITIMAMLL